MAKYLSLMTDIGPLSSLAVIARNGGPVEDELFVAKLKQ